MFEYLLPLVFALAVVGLSVVVYRVVIVVKFEDRTYADKPPKLIGRVWALVELFSFYVSPYLSVEYREKTIRNAMSGAAACCIFLCAVLLPLIGPVGAAIATSLSLAGEKIVEGVVARRRLGISVFPPVGLYALQFKNWLARNDGQRS